ncbi:MAG: hypothetical protein Q7S19_01290, partial [bacterium]|nr:hypothetical protein [bacterium]
MQSNLPKVSFVCEGGMPDGFMFAGILKRTEELLAKSEPPFEISDIAVNSTPALFAALWLGGRSDHYKTILDTLRPENIIAKRDY